MHACMHVCRHIHSKGYETCLADFGGLHLLHIKPELDARRDKTSERIKELHVLLAPAQAAHCPHIRELHCLHLLSLHVENGQGLLRVLHVDRHQVLFACAHYAAGRVRKEGGKKRQSHTP